MPIREEKKITATYHNPPRPDPSVFVSAEFRAGTLNISLSIEEAQELLSALAEALNG